MMQFQKILLIEAVKKNIDLNNNLNWKHELLEKAPPVLWFGDTRTNLPKIITIGANPSREEFLNHHKKNAQKMINNREQKLLQYLKKPRFRTLSQTESLFDILINVNLQEEIIESYNSYFSNNPYINWFGKPNGFKLEAFLNGLNASYYPDKIQYGFNAIHIDLFPFPTISDYKEISGLAEKDLFNNEWSQNFLRNLMTTFIPSPKLIVVFGKTNFIKLKKLFPDSISTQKGRTHYHQNAKGEQISCTYWIGTFDSYKLVGLSVNLGNPRNFTTKDLNNLGTHILKEFNYLIE